jgi:hypothetical protein
VRIRKSWGPEKFSHPPYSCCNSNVAGFQISTAVAREGCGNLALVRSHPWCQREQDAGIPLLRMPPWDISMSIN